MNVGDRIKRRREELGMSVDDVAKRLGKHRSTIYRYESDEIDKFPTDVLESLSAVLMTTPAELMGWDYDSYPSNILPIPNLNQVPLIGSIACGTPILAEENFEDYVDLPEHIKADFALRCIGDSMINAGIRDGDIVYIREQPEVPNGKIAAVMVENNEATLKRFQMKDNLIILWPENSEYEPLTFSGEDMNKVRVIGLAVGYTHSME